MARCAKILGTGSSLPKKKITNEMIEDMVSNFDADRAGMPFTQWVEKVTGIKTRRFIEEENTEMMAAQASQIALDTAGMKASDIEFIVASSFTATRDIPNLACSVGHMIGADGVGGFPLNTACAGFVYALSVAYAMIRSELYKNILVVSAESLSRVINFWDPSTAVLFGDGAGAAVLQASNEGGICSPPYLISDFSDHIHLINSNTVHPRERIFIDGKYYLPRRTIYMPGGPQVLKRAVNGMADVLHKALALSPYELDDLDVIIPHQANLRIADGLIKKLGVSEKKVCRVIRSIGNTSGASVAISLDMAIRGQVNDLRINRGDKVGLTAIAGGYSAGALVFEY